MSSSRLAVVAIQVHAGTGARLYLSALPTHYLATTLGASQVTEGKLRLRGEMFCPAGEQEGHDSDAGGQADVIWTTGDLIWL